MRDEHAFPAGGMTRSAQPLPLLLVLWAVGCGSGGSAATAGAGAAPAAGAGGAQTAAAGNAASLAGGPAGGSGGSGGTAADACPETPALHPANQGSIELGFLPLLGGKPLLVGEPNVMAGGQLLPTNLRFYVSELSFVKSDGSLAPADLVTAAGTAEPYGVHLVNFEEPDSTKIRVLAAAGNYTGARFTFGISDACNAGGTDRKAPLSVNSEMSWPHVAGFLFLRYEGQWTADPSATEPPPPNMIHMGGVIGRVVAPSAAVTGALTVTPGANPARTVRVSFDEIFRGASGTDDVSDVAIPSPEVIAGERLRRSVPNLAIFEFTEP